MIPPALVPTMVGALLCAAAAAQSACPDFGSTPTPATALPSPVALGCPTAPRWPQWHLLTPPHRAPTPHLGHRPGTARPLPAVLVRYRCTGWLLVPVVPAGVRTMGYVIDMPEWPCG